MKLSGLKPEWFEHNGAKFKLKPLSWSQSLEMGALLSAEDLKGAFEFAISHAVVDWDGVEDENGPIAFTEALLDGLPLDVVAVLAKQVIEANLLGAEAEKN